MPKKRLDMLLVEKGLFDSREKPEINNGRLNLC